MFNKGGMLDEGLESIGETAQQLGQTVKNSPQDLTNALQNQLAMQQQSAALQQEHGATNQDIVSSMYGIEANQHQPAINTQTAKQAGQQIGDGNSHLSPEEQQKLQALRKRLHDEYYQKLIAYEHKKPEPSVQDEHEQEKKQEQMKDLEKDKKKPKELPINMRPKGSGEAKHGVGG